MAEWILAKLPLVEEDIKRAEVQLSFHFPVDYRKRIVDINSAFPKKKCFKTKSGVEHVLNNLLSLRASDEKAYICDDQVPTRPHKNQLVAIGRDGFGNLICYSRAGGNPLVYWAHENDTVDPICDSFTELEAMLY